MALLEIFDLHAGYGRTEVLHGISLAFEAHTLSAIVGANGAGKSTLLLALSGIVPIRAGRIVFDGRDLAHVPPHTIVGAGIVHVPEGRRMLAGMTVEENLLVGGRRLGGPQRALELEALYVRFPSLRTRRHLAAGSLSGGEQQMLAIARALIAKPRVLLLDEPSMGLAPKLVENIFNFIEEERARGTTIVLVEQNARKALAVADRAYALERGRITLQGSGAELLHHPEITQAYLGRA